MFTVRSLSLASSVLLLSCIACDRSQLVAPAVEAAFTGAAGPTVKAPSNTKAIAVSESRIDVSWQDNSTNETGFEVWRLDGTFTKVAGTGANITTYVDPGLNALTRYCYQVRAFRTYDGKTSYSQFSTDAPCATTPAPPIPPAPTAPSGADAKPANSTAVDVTWIDNSANEDGFRVERSPDLDPGTTWATVGTVGANITSLRDDGRASEQPLCYRVIAFNTGGDSPPSNADCATPPAGPSDLTAATVEQGIDLAWRDNSGGEEGYELQRAPYDLSFSAVADLPANSTSYRDADAVHTHATLSYRLRAKKDGGFSDFSNVATAVGGCAVFDPACQVNCSAGFCPAGYSCGYDGFCEPHCFDSAWNGDEGDTDCGGSCDAKCQTGQRCTINFDCASGSCVSGRCQP